MLFALPLFGEIAPWDSTKALVNAKDVESVYLPEGFDVPNVCGPADELTICLGYPLDDDETMGIHDDSWPLFVEWPARMLLSSQVTQLPPSSETTSSVELVDSCKKVDAAVLSWYVLNVFDKSLSLSRFCADGIAAMEETEGFYRGTTLLCYR